LIFAVAMVLLDAIINKEWITKASWVLLLLGSLSALAAYLTGRQAADSIGLNLMAESAIGSHSDWAFYTLSFFFIFTGVLFFVTKKAKRNKRQLKIIFAFISLIGLYLIAHTAELGGRLVYEFGLGVSK